MMEQSLVQALEESKASRGTRPEMEDIQLAQQGDAAAFERIYKLHSRRVYGLCLRMTGNQAQAEDLTQEAFLHLFHKIQTFRGDSAFSTWLHRLCVNVVLMRLRKKSLIGASLDELTEPNEETGAPGMEIGAPDMRLGGVVDRLHLQHAIDQLAPGYKEMFLLHDVEGYEHNEIAEMVGCSVGNSKSQLHKARMCLRSLLGDTARETARNKRRAMEKSSARNTNAHQAMRGTVRMALTAESLALQNR
jgi:RNA polymerase sigma-70 factor (ECF subfamily)